MLLEKINYAVYYSLLNARMHVLLSCHFLSSLLAFPLRKYQRASTFYRRFFIFVRAALFKQTLRREWCSYINSSLHITYKLSIGDNKYLDLEIRTRPVKLHKLSFTWGLVLLVLVEIEFLKNFLFHYSLEKILLKIWIKWSLC